jgi:dissimilatory sulfite reductase (desulfoviridin) alpha/beta subunit
MDEKLGSCIYCAKKKAIVTYSFEYLKLWECKCVLCGSCFNNIFNAATDRHEKFTEIVVLCKERDRMLRSQMTSVRLDQCIQPQSLPWKPKEAKRKIIKKTQTTTIPFKKQRRTNTQPKK